MNLFNPLLKYGFQKAINYLGSLSSSPSNGKEGDFYYHTTADELVYYDSTRNKWLSISSTTFLFQKGTSMTNTAKMNVGDVIMTDGSAGALYRGFLIPSNSTLIEFSLNAQANTVNTTTILLYVNNSHSSPLYTTTMSVGTTKKVDSSIDVNLAANDVVGIRIEKSGDTTGVLNQPIGHIVIKKRF